MTMPFGLNRTLGVAIALIAFVSVAATFVILANLDTLRTTDLLRTQDLKARRRLLQVQLYMLDQETGVRGLVITDDPASLRPYTEAVPKQAATIAELQDLIGKDPELAADLSDALAAVRTWQTKIGQPIAATINKPMERDAAAELERSGDGRRLFDIVRERLDRIEQRLQARLTAQTDSLNRAIQATFDTLVASAIVIGALSFVVGVAINRGIAQPLLRLTAAMRRLAGRDLKTSVPSTRRRDEIGDMARAVSVFKQGLIEAERTSLVRAIADTVPPMIGYIDKARRVRFLNGAFETWFDLNGAKVTELTEEPIDRVFPGRTLPGTPDQLSSALQGYPSRVDHRLTAHARPEDGVRDVEVAYQPHQSIDGELLGTVVTITDITQRKEIDRRLTVQARDLKRSNEELEQFAYVASHDLKAPLRGIENLVTWIEEDIAETLQPDTRANMDLLRSRVRRLDSLLNDLLEYSRAGRRTEGAEPIDTRRLATDLAALISPPPGFVITVADDLPTVLAPRAPLTQVFQNLMGNAVKHHNNPAGGHIWVSAAPQGDAVQFAVADDGPGIPKRFHERVFGMFQTLRPRDEVEGSGMGLAIVKKLMEAQGGSVSLAEREGGGLVVRFLWPSPALGGTAETASTQKMDTA